jgi:hypothetical protein
MEQQQYIPEYTAEVNRDSINMSWLTGHLNNMGKKGWRLHTIFQQERNTVMVFERMVPAR